MGLSLSKDVADTEDNTEMLPRDDRVYSFSDEENLADRESTLRVEAANAGLLISESTAASACESGLYNDKGWPSSADQQRLEKDQRAAENVNNKAQRSYVKKGGCVVGGQDVELDCDDKDGPHPPPVELDDGRSMEEVYGNVENFYVKLVKAAECLYLRPNDNAWLSKLRFLTPFDQPMRLKNTPPANMLLCGQRRRTPGAPPDLASPCCNLRGYRSFTGSETNRLRLTDFNEITSCTHFVAVSYVWSNWPKENTDDGYKIIDSEGVARASRASNRLIRWAIDYAAYWGLPFIWIDQECIDQSDRGEKQAHIDDMDRIFRRAAKVIAPLTTTIERGSQLKLAQRLLAFEARKPDQASLNKDDVRELGCRLFRDDWFSRAWTLQENVSATLPYEIDLLVEPDPVSHEGEFAVISLWMYPAVGRVGLNTDVAHRLLPLRWVLEFERGPDPDSNDCYCKESGYIKPTRVLNAQQALKALHSKGIELAEDRMGIMANMARYSTRLDLAKCKDEELDMGTCVFAQAMLNGDMSLTLAYRHYLDPWNKSDSLRWKLSQDSLSATLGLRKSINYTHGYAPHALERNGIRVKGQLWKKYYCIDFGQLLSNHGRISVPKPGVWCRADNEMHGSEAPECHFNDFFDLSHELVKPESPVLERLERHYLYSTGFIVRELLRRQTHLQEDALRTAMALAIGDLLLSSDPKDFDRFGGNMPTEPLMRLCRCFGWHCIPAVIDRLSHAQIEVYAPAQCNTTYSRTMIFWNRTIRPAPAAIFTCRKVNDDSEPKYEAVVIAWTLQSTQPENGDQLVLDDHLPREIHSADEYSPRYDPFRWYCKLGRTRGLYKDESALDEWEKESLLEYKDQYKDNFALSGWENEYLLKWN